MLSSLETVKNALLTVTENCGHYEAVNQEDKYIVWAEQLEESGFSSDNVKREHTIGGTIDYFTTDEDDAAFSAIPAALIEAGIGWNLLSVQYEEETHFIHYQWGFFVRQYYAGAEPEAEDGTT